MEHFRQNILQKEQNVIFVTLNINVFGLMLVLFAKFQPRRRAVILLHSMGLIPPVALG